jgi:adenylate cyclase
LTSSLIRARWLKPRTLIAYAACVAVGFALHFSRLLDPLDRKLLDLAFTIERAHFPQPAHNDIVVVGVDEAFLREAPEPLALLHEHLGRLFGAVAAGKPRVVGLDIVLPAKSFSFLKTADRPDFDFDRALAKGLLVLGNAAPVIAAETWDHEHGRFNQIHPAFVASVGQWLQRRPDESAAGFRPLGSALVCPDEDSIVREYPAAACQPGGGTTTLTSQLAELVDRKQPWQGFINYGIGGKFSYIPARELIAWWKAGDANLEQLRDKLVLVGAVLDTEDRLKAAVELAGWEPGNLRVPGVLIQAQILRSMMNQGLVQRAPTALVLVLIAAVAAFWFGSSFRLKAALFLALAIALLAATLALLRTTVFLAPLSVLATGLLALGASGLAAAHGHWRERQHLTRTFSGYVSPQVMKGIIAGEISPGQAGEMRLVCVLFSDIRDFTTLSEGLAPDVVVALLNRYFDVMAEIVHRHGGSVDKFIGDGMMAVFGAPQGLPCREKNALEAAHEMLIALADLNAAFRRDGLPELRIGIGLHTGDAVVGHLGSRERHEYTAIGDAVNVAARVTDLPKTLGAPIVCTEPVAAALGHPVFLRAAGTQALKGHSSLAVYTWSPDVART